MLLSSRLHKGPSHITRLHQAASDGNVREIKAIMRQNPNSVFELDNDGLTALHYATLNGHFEAVKALTPNGEAIYMLDKSGCLPITYVDSVKHPEIIDYLLKKFSYPAGTTDVHFAAAEGNVNELKRLLEDPTKLDLINGILYTPLMYAALNNQKKAVEYLVNQGADVDVLDLEQNDLVSIASDLPILGYIKQICGMTNNELNHIKLQFQHIIEKEMAVCASQNKKLLIIIGERHYLYKVLQLEEMMLRVAINTGINTLLAEARPHQEIDYPCDVKAQALGMNVMAIDHPSLEATFEQRNACMTQAIFDANQSAVVRIGAEHLQGILEMPSDPRLAALFHERFHIVPFSLSSLFKNDLANTPESQFARNENHAILVTQQGLSRPDAALARWNTPQNQGFLNSVMNFIMPYLLSNRAIKQPFMPDATEEVPAKKKRRGNKD